MFKIFLALKYLIRRRIALFAIGSVALCVVLMIIITSLFNGFLDLYNKYWQHEFGQVTLLHDDKNFDFKAAAEYLEKQPGIDYVRLSASSGGLLFLNNGNVRQVTIRGIDLGLECRASQFRNGLLKDQTARGQFIMPEDKRIAAEKWLADKLKKELEPSDLPAAIPCIMSVGLLDEVDPQTDKYDTQAILQEIENWSRPAFIFTGNIEQSEQETKISRKNIRCWPIDAIETGSNHLDEGTLYLPFDYVCREFNVRPDILVVGKTGISDTELSIMLQNIWPTYLVDVLGLESEELGKSRLSISSQQPWILMFTREINKQLATMQVILGFVCIVAAVLIFVIIMMIVLQKRRDIGIIRASGGSESSVSLLFLNYGLLIGISGTILGLFIGFWAVKNIEMLEQGLSALLGFKIWKSGSYGFGQIPNWVHWGSLWWIASSGIVTAALGALVPAIKAARCKPTESLRFE